jgi:hypothetical protein
VACVRYHYRLPNVAKGHDWLTLTQAAQQLGVSAHRSQLKGLPK